MELSRKSIVIYGIKQKSIVIYGIKQKKHCHIWQCFFLLNFDFCFSDICSITRHVMQ